MFVTSGSLIDLTGSDSPAPESKRRPSDRPRKRKSPSSRSLMPISDRFNAEFGIPPAAGKAVESADGSGRHRKGRSKASEQPAFGLISSCTPAARSCFGMDWCVAYSPSLCSDLCIHPKKLTEFRSLLRSALEVQTEAPRILIMSGPPGTAKSTTLDCLARELGADLLHFDSVSQYHSSSPAFAALSELMEFVHRGSRYGAASGRPVILSIEEFQIDRDSSSRHLALDSSLASLLLQSRVPIVFQLTLYNEGGEMELEDIFAPLLHSGRCARCKFNPIAPSFMQKAIKRILDSSGCQRSFSASQLAELIAQARGDLRSAINTAQFLCQTSSSQSDSPLQVTSRDSGLSLFHGLGRLLYHSESSSCVAADLAAIDATSDSILDWLHANWLPWIESRPASASVDCADLASVADSLSAVESQFAFFRSAAFGDSSIDLEGFDFDGQTQGDGDGQQVDDRLGRRIIESAAIAVQQITNLPTGGDSAGSGSGPGRFVFRGPESFKVSRLAADRKAAARIFGEERLSIDSLRSALVTDRLAFGHCIGLEVSGAALQGLRCALTDYSKPNERRSMAFSGQSLTASAAQWQQSTILRLKAQQESERQLWEGDDIEQF